MSEYSDDHLINPRLLGLATSRIKRAFVPGGDPAAMGGGGAPPGGDPAAGGGAPPMDPAMMGGAPPPDAGGGGGGGDPLASLQPMIQQAVQAAMQQQGGGMAGGGGGAGGPLKPKIDVNVALMQLSKMVARIADSLGVQIPAHEMIATPQDLTSMATQQSTGAPAGAGAGGGGGGGGGGAIGGMPPMDPMQAAGPMGGGGGEKASSYQRNEGDAFDTSAFADTGDRISAVAQLLRTRRDAA